MNDLISRSEAKKIANKFTFTFAEERERYMDFLDYCLKNAPTVDAKPVRGEWERTRLAGEYLCSNCQSLVYASYTKTGYKLFSYCPECGADMRKQVENEKK